MLLVRRVLHAADRIYSLGGFSNGVYSNTVEYLDLATGIPGYAPNMTASRSQFAAVYLNGMAKAFTVDDLRHSCGPLGFRCTAGRSGLRLGRHNVLQLQSSRLGQFLR